MEAQVVHHRLRQLLDPIFLVALALLLLNDHVWKTAYGNFWTGKLSDFAGLYAFAWVGMSLLPRRRKLLAGLMAIAFVLWKSPLATPLLDGWNMLGILPLARVVDMGDCLALVVLPLAVLRWDWMAARSTSSATGWLALRWLALAVSVVAFSATSYKNEFDYTDRYFLPVSTREVVARLNALNAEKNIGNPDLSLHHPNANEFQQAGNYRIYLHHNQTTQTHYDTIYAQIDDSIFVDEIRSYEVPAIDSIYVNPDGVFRFAFALRPKTDPDTLPHCQQVPAILKLEAEGNGSRLHLLHIECPNCQPLPADEKTLEPAAYLRSKFEEEIVARLKMPR